jgi:LPS-assembly protein
VYQLDGQDVVDKTRMILVPIASLDGGLVFERDQGGYVQTMEPHFLYSYAAYRDQNDLPNFDTANTTFSFAQLFRDSRFAGGDRIDDANQMSLGLTSRVINSDSGEEVVRASIGQIAYFRDRKVRLDPNLNPVATDASSNVVAALAAPVGRGWSSTAEAQWTHNLEYVQQYGFNFNYLPESRDRLFNIGYNFRREDPTIGQEKLQQANTSFLQPIGINWQLIGLLQYDFLNREIQDSVVGLQYESCCWRVRAFRRTFLADPSNVSANADRLRSSVFIEFELKGLAGVSGGISSLLGKNMFGYSQLAEHTRSRTNLSELPQ